VSYLIIVVIVFGVCLAVDILAFLCRKYDYVEENSKLFQPIFLHYFLSVDTQEKLFGGYFSLNDDYAKSKESKSEEWENKLSDSGYRWIRVEQEKEIHEREILKVLLGLDDEKLDKLLEFYEKKFGKGAARYARKTYRKWESGKVRPIRQTYERFLLHLPDVMSFDMKTELLRRLMEAYCKKDSYDLTVYTDDWEETLEPLVQKLIDKPYNASLPKQIEDRLIWLAHDDMQAAEKILKQSQVEEGKLGVSMLREEFANIEHLLANTKGRRKVTHKLKFPYGTINLKIKRR
jgi:hypothetical protein